MISFGLFGLGLLLIGVAIFWEVFREFFNKPENRFPQYLATLGYLLCCIVWLWCAGYLAAQGIQLVSN